MNDEEMNEGPLSLSLDEVEAPSLEEEGEEEEVVSPLAGLSPQDALSQLLASERQAAQREQELFQAELKRIQDAKDRLLGKPKELTGRERLDIILKTLSSRPTDLRDPRFFERKNIGTFLRDIGEAGGAMRETEKTRAEEMQKQLDELEALKGRYLLPRAQAELKDVRGRIPAAMKATQGPAQTAYMRNLEDRARMLGITPEELVRRDQAVKEREPPSAGISSVEIGRVIDDVNATLGPIKSNLSTINSAKTFLKQAREGNAKANAQLDRFLATLAGDKQLSQIEVSTVADAGSFPGRVVSGFSKLISGVPSELSLDEKEAVLEALENLLGPYHNRERKRLLDAYSATNIPRDVLSTTIGGQYVTAQQKRAAQGGGAAQPPQGAIDMLRANPGLAADFDAKYGAGASKRYLGE